MAPKKKQTALPVGLEAAVPVAEKPKRMRAKAAIPAVGIAKKPRTRKVVVKAEAVTAPVEVVIEAPAPVVAPARAVKPAKPRRQLDSVTTLYEKFLVACKTIQDESYANEADRKAKAIIDRGNDDYPTRLAMLHLMLEVRSTAAEYSRFEKRMANEVNPAWAEAQKAWIDWVGAEKIKNHNGQLAMARAFYTRFAGMQARIATLWQDGPDAMDGVRIDLQKLVSEVASYIQPGWCIDCGAPVWEIAPKGKTPFVPNRDRACHERTLAALDDAPAPTTKKPHVKKPHSAEKRGKGCGPKGKPGTGDDDGARKRAKKAAKAARRGEGE